MAALAPTDPLVHRTRELASRHRRALVGAVVLVALLALAVPVGLATLGRTGGFASGSSGGEEGRAAAGVVTAPQAGSDAGAKGGAAAGTDAPAGSAQAGASGSAAIDVIGPKLARAAWLGMQVADLAAASARARLITSEAGGVVTFENVVTAADPSGRYGAPATSGAPAPGSDGTGTLLGGGQYPPVGVDEARMTLNVPSEKLDGVLTELSRIGSVSYRSSQTQDVTDAYVDTKARIEPMRAGIARLKALLAKTTDLQQVIALESELTSRQADLDSLTRRLAELDARTTTSDVTLSLWTSGAAPAATADDGFTAGLRDAWNGLLRSVTVILTGLAALLPWLVVLGVVGFVVMRFVRRRGTGGPAAGAGAP